MRIALRRMQKHTKSVVALLLAVIAISCGCSRQKALARRFSQADRVILTNYPGSSAFAIPLTAEERKNLVHAISAAQKEKPSDANMLLKIEFFKGTNLLGVVAMGMTGRPDRVGIFAIDKVAYSDKTGVFEMLGEKFLQARATPSVDSP
jgi:hypothetical protein